MKKQSKKRIRQNVWGNWYGYEGRNKVATFFDSPEGTQAEHAKNWLEGKADKRDFISLAK